MICYVCVDTQPDIDLKAVAMPHEALALCPRHLNAWRQYLEEMRAREWGTYPILKRPTDD